MSIKAFRESEFENINGHSFDQLKMQYTLSRLTAPPNLHLLHHQHKTHQYIQVNYLKNHLYKVYPQLDSRIPLQKQQQNLKDYLMDLHHDADKHHEIQNQLKLKFFFKQNPSKNQSHSKRLPHSTHKKDKHNNIIQIFDPIEYLQQQQSKKKKMLSKNIKRLQDMHTFAQNIDSVKYVSEAPHMKIPEPLPSLGNKSLMSFTSQKDSQLHKTQREISKSISQIMEKSLEYQGKLKNGSKRLKHYKSRNDLKKANDKKILTQRNKIMSMIQQKQSVTTKSTAMQPTCLNQIPAKQKYVIDFTLYMRTKTKSQLDKYMHQKLIKKPEKDLQKFHEFMLKEVKFQNDQNRHKMERFFIKMREEFRRVEKYSERGSKFDWRSMSVRLDEVNKESDVIGTTNVMPSQLSTKEKTKTSEQNKFKSARERFPKVSKVQSVQKRKQKNKQELGSKINGISESIGDFDGQNQIRQDQQVYV